MTLNLILLPPPPQCWNDRHLLWHQDRAVLRVELGASSLLSEDSADWDPSEVLRWPYTPCQQASLVFLKIKQEKKIGTKPFPASLKLQLQESIHKSEPCGVLSKCRCHLLLVFHLTSFDHQFLIKTTQLENSKYLFNCSQQPATHKADLILWSKLIVLKQSRPELI